MMNGEFYKCQISKNGYYVLCHEYLHRIIAEKFLPDWDPNKEVDHINTIKTQNMVWNLRMSTRLQNMNNPLTIKRIKQNMNNPLTIQRCRERVLAKPITPPKSVLQYTLDNKFITEYVSTHEAERQTNIYHGNITKCCKHKVKSAGGYIWKYKEE